MERLYVKGGETFHGTSVRLGKGEGGALLHCEFLILMFFCVVSFEEYQHCSKELMQPYR